MPTLLEYQNQFKAALERAPDFLVFVGFYVYKTEGSTYDPATDNYTGTSTDNVIINCLRGLETISGENLITFVTESLPFTFGKPTTSGTLVVGEEAWNIRSIRADPIGLTYTFTVENKDGSE